MLSAVFMYSVGCVKTKTLEYFDERCIRETVLKRRGNTKIQMSVITLAGSAFERGKMRLQLLRSVFVFNQGFLYTYYCSK